MSGVACGPASLPIQSFVPFTRRALGECTLHLFPHCSPLPVRPTTVSCLAAASPLVASSLHLSQLPWPATRFSWPPPSSLRCGCGVGPQRLRIGECRRVSLSRGRGQGVVGRSCAGHGFGPSRMRSTTAALRSSPMASLSSRQGAQLAVDTTAVSVLRWDGVPRRRVVNQDGAALDAARRRKERVYPELTGQLGRTRLVVLACEVAGCSSEDVDFLDQLAKAKARREPRHLRVRARQALPAEVGHSFSVQCCESFWSLAVGAQERLGLRRLHPTHHGGDQ